MPYYRARIRCACASPEPPKLKKPRAPRKKLTAEEAAAASEKREAKKKWKESLVNWTQDIEFKWPPGTLATYKTYAKTQYGLNDADIRSLRYETTYGGFCFYSYSDVKDIAFRKHAMGAMKDGFQFPESTYRPYMRLFSKRDHIPKRRFRTNWTDLGNVDLGPKKQNINL